VSIAIGDLGEGHQWRRASGPKALNNSGGTRDVLNVSARVRNPYADDAARLEYPPTFLQEGWNGKQRYVLQQMFMEDRLSRSIREGKRMAEIPGKINREPDQVDIDPAVQVGAAGTEMQSEGGRYPPSSSRSPRANAVGKQQLH
jgi:hypothetical protein